MKFTNAQCWARKWYIIFGAHEKHFQLSFDVTSFNATLVKFRRMHFLQNTYGQSEQQYTSPPKIITTSLSVKIHYPLTEN